MARAKTPRRGRTQRIAERNDERALRLLHQAISLLEAGELATTRRRNPDDDDEDPTRRLGSAKLRR